jgi:hypothetical protein
MATPSAAASFLLLLILLAVYPIALRADDGGGYDVVSMARSGSAVSARLELAGESKTMALEPDVKALSVTARQVSVVCTVDRIIGA